MAVFAVLQCLPWRFNEKIIYLCVIYIFCAEKNENMADFNYSFDKQNIAFPKYEKLYAGRLDISDALSVYHNDGTVIRVQSGDDSMTLLGYAFCHGMKTEEYMAGVLRDFSGEAVPRIKKELLGQYIVLVRKGGTLYMFSDFMQVGGIFYSVERKVASSSFDAACLMAGMDTDPYKQFEFIAMKYSAYPAWLGNTTVNRRVCRLRACEYLAVDAATGCIELCDFKIEFDNRKNPDVRALREKTLALLHTYMRHPEMKDAKVQSTITGGFDSRFVSSLVKEYYSDVTLRICVNKGVPFLDYDMAEKAARTIGLPLKVYRTEPSDVEWFYMATDSLSPRENSIMASLFRSTGDYRLGFGGTFGTELYSSFAANNPGEHITDLMDRAKNNIRADKRHFERLEQAFRDEFNYIEQHYVLARPDGKDLVRIFKLINTAYFASPLVRSFAINGNQFEIFPTFPIIEAGLQIPYRFDRLMDRLGNFYLIPKGIMRKVNPKVSRLLTTNFAPMRPLTPCSLPTYLRGKLFKRRYYAMLAKMQPANPTVTLYKGDGWEYSTANRWVEGFAAKYIG